MVEADHGVGRSVAAHPQPWQADVDANASGRAPARTPAP